MEMTHELTRLNAGSENALARAFEKADALLSKNYLEVFGNAAVAPPGESAVAADAEALNKVVRFFEIGQIVLDATENARDKLVSVFNAAGSAGAGVVVLVQGTKDRVTLDIGIKTKDLDATGTCAAILQNCLSGNFPGSKMHPVRKDGLEQMLQKVFGNKECSIVSVTDIPGLRSEQENRERRFAQGIEKVVDAMQGREYTILLIADPVGTDDLADSRRNLENLHSDLAPFAELSMTIGASETEAVSQSIAKTVSESASKSVADTLSKTVGESVSESQSDTASGSVLVADYSHGWSRGSSQSISDTNSRTIGQIEAHTSGTTATEGTNRAKGSSRAVQLKLENQAVKGLLKRIDKTLERYGVCADVGMWNCAAYVLSAKRADAEMAASVYHSVVRGKNSSLEAGRVATWQGEAKDGALEYLRRFMHPVVEVAGLKVTPGALVSSAELAIAAGLPNTSLPGLPVLECARFGRSVSTYDATESNCGETYSVRLGKIWNMNREEGIPVRLDPDSLASHTFITGSTGSGKSNTIYRMLSELASKAATFLVIEPDKGEYRNVLGRDANVAVYGTNPASGALLRINPFSFPKEVHIFEHLDRLVEIFNVCWPMYAAMPAVLKDAIEKAYEECGWNLVRSSNPYGERLYPTFEDVARCVKAIIDSSEYDAENKGAYKGSLITRLRSLTNGINSLVFAEDELSAKELFDRNVIADLSRVGSSETKALIMGILVLKLQEHRMSGGLANANLRHVTVLEEAHHLLRRSGGTGATGGEAGGGATLLAKSVEMLANAIAVMRTYGEGFIIADQSPGLLDMSVIRNTNTKIAMRLPDKGDRELVGRAMRLDDAQIAELARLPRGVAAVCQNEWIESVLCKIEKHEVPDGGNGKLLGHMPANEDEKNDGIPTSQSLALAALLLSGTPLPAATAKDWEGGRIRLSARSRVIVEKARKGEIESPKFTQTGTVVAELFPKAAKALRETVRRSSDKDAWNRETVDALPEVEGQLRRDIVQALATEILLHEMNRKADFENWYTHARGLFR